MPGWHLEGNQKADNQSHSFHREPKKTLRIIPVNADSDIFRAAPESEPELHTTPYPMPSVSFPEEHLTPKPVKKKCKAPVDSPSPRLPPDPFSLVTVIMAIILSFFIPPLGLYLAFGKVKKVRIDLILFLSGIVFLILAFLIAINGGTAIAPAALILLWTSVAVLAASVLYAIFHLLRVLIKAPPRD